MATCASVRAIIDGKEVEVTLARTIYNMEKLKKNQEKLLEDIDKNKLLDEIFHFCTPDIFKNEGIELLDWNGEPLAEDTEHVLVPVPHSFHTSFLGGGIMCGYLSDYQHLYAPTCCQK